MTNPETARRIYLSAPHLMGDEEVLVAEAFATNWVAPLGPHVDAFEAEFAATVQVPYAAALSSGTAGLHLGMRLLGVEPGDHVICSSLTFSASANPIAYERAIPVFVDADATWQMDPNCLEDALRAADRIGKRPKAAVVVDLYGQSADFDVIGELCERFDVPIIEDAAEALGGTYRGRPTGARGRMGIFSFNGNKIITTSGGGMLVSHDRSIVERARFLATQARDAAPHYQHSAVGFNYRLSNVLAAIGRAQLRSLDERVRLRRAIFARYHEALSPVPGVAFMPEAAYGTTNRWLTCLTVDPQGAGVDREDIRLALEAENIEARPVWKPLHMQPVFAGAPVFGAAVSERLFAHGLCLPSGSGMRADEQDRVIATILRCVEKGTTVRR